MAQISHGLSVFKTAILVKFSQIDFRDSKKCKRNSIIEMGFEMEKNEARCYFIGVNNLKKKVFYP